MSVITATVQLNEKNTRTVNTKNGETLIASVPLFGKEKGADVKIPYGSAFMPTFIKIGDVVTISGRVEAKQSGEYVNYNFLFPTVEKVYVDGVQKDFGGTPDGDLFGETSEVADIDLPF